ncbi:MAG: hypothetical protein AAF798_19450 [Bacteroidota bacterium]
MCKTCHTAPKAGVSGKKVPELDTLVENVAKKDFVRPSLSQLRRVGGRLLGGRECQCGRAIIGSGSAVALVEGSDGTFYSGLQSCGNVWSCPVCQFKILEHRARTIKGIVHNALADNCRIGFVTLTVPHHAFQKLDDLRGLVTDSMRKIRQSRYYRRMIGKDSIAGEFGVNEQTTLKLESRGRARSIPSVILSRFKGDIRTLEVTHGKNGWHPHLHILFFAKCSEKQMEVFTREVFSLWAKQVEKAGFGKCSSKAFRYDAVKKDRNLADYLAKWDLAKEMTGSGSKQAKKSGRTPMQLLCEVAQSRNDSHPSSRLFREYAKAFKGKQKITINGGLEREYLTTDAQLEAAMSDEKIAAEKQAGKVIGYLAKAVWRQVIISHWEDLVKAHAESGGMEEVTDVLNDLGVECYYDISLMMVRAGPEKRTVKHPEFSICLPPP